MINKVGFIPAAGKGTRWGKFHKEMLPIGENRWLIDSAIDAFRVSKVEHIYIVTSQEKIGVHSLHFQNPKYSGLEISFLIQKYQEDIWGAFKTFLPFAGKMNYFVMADTLIPSNSFPDYSYLWDSDLASDFNLGLFTTDKPDRFGVIHDGRIVNKSKDLVGEHKAWGTMLWTEFITDFWNKVKPLDYTDAINLALEHTKPYYYNLDYYYDFASWKDYQEWMELNSK